MEWFQLRSKYRGEGSKAKEVKDPKLANAFAMGKWRSILYGDKYSIPSDESNGISEIAN